MLTRSSLRLLIPVLLLFGVLALPRPCAACSCASVPGPPDRELAEAAAVFRGRVTDVSGTRGGTVERRVTFQVNTVWKGPATSRIVVGSGAGSCGYEFTNNDEYLVYAYGESPDALSTNICRRVRPIATAGEDLQALGPGTAVTMPPSGDRFGVAYGKLFPLLGVISVALLTAGLALWTRRTRMRLGAEEALRR